MKKFYHILLGLLATGIIAVIANLCASFVPMNLVSAGVFAMIIGMCLHPLIKKLPFLNGGIQFTSKKVLKIAIILMGVTLSFTQVLNVGKYSLIVMCFTLASAFGLGNLLGRLFKMNWKLSNLISAGTGICGGSAIAAISPVIDADDSDVAYAISATFIFDIVMVIIFPLIGRALHMSDMGYGLWAGTAVNDTSSVVAAGYAFSDLAGQFATVVKLTRTLSIVPIVLIFAFVNGKIKKKEAATAQPVKDEVLLPPAKLIESELQAHSDNTILITDTSSKEKRSDDSAESGKPEAKIQSTKVSLRKIFPWFILMFLALVALRTIADALIGTTFAGNWLTEDTLSGAVKMISSVSKFAMVMALGAIGLKTDFKKVAKSGVKPMLHGFIISALVVVVAFFTQYLLGQM